MINCALEIWVSAAHGSDRRNRKPSESSEMWLNAYEMLNKMFSSSRTTQTSLSWLWHVICSLTSSTRGLICMLSIFICFDMRALKTLALYISANLGYVTVAHYYVATTLNIKFQQGCGKCVVMFKHKNHSVMALTGSCYSSKYPVNGALSLQETEQCLGL